MQTTNNMQGVPATDVSSSVDDKEVLQDEIAALAAMPMLKYEREYKEVAKRLGMRASVLDSAVKTALTGERKDAAAMFQDDEPWDSPVDVAAVILELTEAFGRYSVLPVHADVTLALWCIYTWVFDASYISPLLVIRSPEKGCGKSTVIEILKRLVFRPLVFSGMTAPVLFRVIDKHRPTVLIDEGDTFLNNENLELHGVINSGYSKTAPYLWRCVGDDHEPTAFYVFGPKVIALIGYSRDTLHDRAIEIELRRKFSHEKIERLRYSDGAELLILRRKLARLAADRIDNYTENCPVMPDSLPDRQADNWEPLLKVAMLAGDKWIRLATEAALALTATKAANSQASVGVELLADIQHIFQAKGTPRIRSVDLIKFLCEEEDGAWATYNRGKSITPKQVSKRLAEFGIKAKSVRLDRYGVQKCFDVAWFADAFARYLPASDLTVTQLQPNNDIASDVTDVGAVTVTLDATVTPEPCNDGDRNRVTGKPLHSSGDVCEVEL